MTVKELIEKLSKLEQEKEIELSCKQCSAEFGEINVFDDKDKYTIS